MDTLSDVKPVTVELEEFLGKTLLKRAKLYGAGA